MGIFSTNSVILDEKLNLYKDKDGKQYRRVTKAIDLICVPFDKETTAHYMSIASDIPKSKEEFLAEWEAKRKSAGDRGDYIHGQISSFLKKGECNGELMQLVMILSKLWKNAYRYYSEQILSSETYQVAGCADLIIQRQKSKLPVIDIYDFKTNEAKGIVISSVVEKDGGVKNYNRFMLYPLDYLEDCNFTRYCLQLGIYALIAETEYDVRIGSLAIIFIGEDYKVRRYPVPYMKLECQRLLEHIKELKSLPWKEEGGETKRIDE